MVSAGCSPSMPGDPNNQDPAAGQPVPTPLTSGVYSGTIACAVQGVDDFGTTIDAADSSQHTVEVDSMGRVLLPDGTPLDPGATYSNALSGSEFEFTVDRVTVLSDGAFLRSSARSSYAGAEADWLIEQSYRMDGNNLLFEETVTIAALQGSTGQSAFLESVCVGELTGAGSGPTVEAPTSTPLVQGVYSGTSECRTTGTDAVGDPVDETSAQPLVLDVNSDGYWLLNDGSPAIPGNTQVFDFADIRLSLDITRVSLLDDGAVFRYQGGTTLNNAVISVLGSEIFRNTANGMTIESEFTYTGRNTIDGASISLQFVCNTELSRL